MLDIETAADVYRPAGEIMHHDFLTPTVLSGESRPVKAVIIGQCIFAAWQSVLLETFPDIQLETELFNNAWDLQPRDCSDIDFQLVSVPLRAVLHESAYMRLDYADQGAFKALFDECCQRMAFVLDTMMTYNKKNGLRSFVANFFVPIANPLGRLLPRNDLRNLVYFVEEINRHLAELVAGYTSAHMLDINQIASVVGKRFVQDDSVSAIAHNAIMVEHASNWDAQRIEPPSQSLPEMFMIQEREFIIAAWHELTAMYRTLQGTDSVKMVIMDLDDTLWRGVAGDAGGVDNLEQAEGWPLGVAEALTFLKKRGIMLAIASKNEESYIREIWPYGGSLELDDFAFIRINWKPKAENVAEMIAIANILPSSVVFVDDNPVERRAVSVANPGIRTLGANPYLIRSALLWSSETQVPFITEESARRTSMMQAQERRESSRAAMSREDFLASQQIKFAMAVVDESSPRFARAFELLNKTNQFNTTGKRWSDMELRSAMQDGLALHCFTVTDRFTDYGLVGVVLTRDTEIEQFTMSCRVLGMEVEIGALNILNNAMLENAGGAPVTVTAKFTETPANFPCRDLYERAGYVRDGEGWSKAMSEPAPIPPQLNRAEFN